MTKKLCIYIFFVCTSALTVVSCTEKKATEPAQNGTFSISGSVHAISLSSDEAAFPDKPGRKEFLMNCTICHSNRYIAMQPDFPRKTWEAEVKKMVEKFGAPVTPENQKLIIDYLASVKGK